MKNDLSYLNGWRYCWFICGNNPRNPEDDQVFASVKTIISSIDPAICIQKIDADAYYLNKKHLIRKIRKDDVLLFGTGDPAQDLLSEGDTVIKDALHTWHENTKIIFSAPFRFSEYVDKQSELNEIAQLCKGNHDVLAVNDQESYAYAVRHFSCRIFNVPWLSQNDDLPMTEQGASDNEFLNALRAELSKDYEKQQAMVSVIIPAYNEEAYIAECLESATGQTLKDTEIICVDDGSTDGTPQILDQYAEKDGRIKVIHQENGGLSRARNAGMEYAAGKYMLFLDSDDMLVQNALELLVQKAEILDTDMLLYNHSAFCDDPMLKDEEEHYSQYYRRKGKYDEVYTGTEMQELLVRNKDYRPIAWGYLLNTEFARKTKLSFIPGILHEDNPFTFHAMTLAGRVSLLSCTLYKRRIHAGSIMQTKQSFRNVYGYLAGMIDMMKTASDIQGPGQMTEAQTTIIGNVAKNAVNIWSSLSEEEQEKWKLLSEEEKTAFRSCFLAKSMEGRIHSILQQTYEEKSEINAKLQKTYREKSELNTKLQQTYREKSELNAKLQQTYAEKTERGKQIRELDGKLREAQEKIDSLSKGNVWRVISAVRNASGIHKKSGDK